MYDKDIKVVSNAWNTVCNTVAISFLFIGLQSIQANNIVAGMTCIVLSIALEYAKYKMRT